VAITLRRLNSGNLIKICQIWKSCKNE
jgi:hypothetical protein